MILRRNTRIGLVGLTLLLLVGCLSEHAPGWLIEKSASFCSERGGIKAIWISGGYGTGVTVQCNNQELARFP